MHSSISVSLSVSNMIAKLTILVCLLAVAHSRKQIYKPWLRSILNLKFTFLYSISNSQFLLWLSGYTGLDFQVPLFGSRIVGGHDAEEGEFPHQVSLQLGLPGVVDFQHFCGGSIIKSDWILTAVHCLDAVEEAGAQFPIAFVVKAGKRDLSEVEDTEQVALVKAYFKHKKYIGGGWVVGERLLKKTKQRVLRE